MTPRIPVAPNNRNGKMRSAFLSSLGSQNAKVSFPKSNERASIVKWGGNGRGVQGESVNSGSPRPVVIRRQYGTRAN
jgi:hypothetical protein